MENELRSLLAQHTVLKLAFTTLVNTLRETDPETAEMFMIVLNKLPGHLSEPALVAAMKALIDDLE